MKKSRFWQGFTWKRFGRIFLLVLAFNIAWNFLFRDWSFNRLPDILSWNMAGKTLTRTLLLSFLITIWHEPPAENKD